MHMSDALLSPTVGGVFWLVSGTAIAYASRRVSQGLDQRMVPLMGVLGAFVFAAQMVNFTIPGTGASGHLVGTTLLAILLGPHAAFLAIASVLVVQAFLFADGGILALGANIFNLGVLPCYFVFPLLYARLMRGRGGAGYSRRMGVAAFIVAVVSLQAGSLGLVVQTTLSGISELPFATFLSLMLPIHLVVGFMEGFVTIAVLRFLEKAQPEILQRQETEGRLGRAVGLLLVLMVVTGGTLSWFASENPDGLEWSMAKVTQGRGLAEKSSDLHQMAGQVQQNAAVLPDYQLPEESKLGTSLSGLLGGAVTLLLAGSLGWWLSRRRD